jgi:hypothetical protein
MPDQLADLPDYLFARPADLPAAHVRDNAEAAHLIAPLHDGDQGLGPFHLRLPLRLFHVRGIAVEADLHRAVPQRTHFLHHLSKPMDVMGPEYQIQIGDPPQKVLSFLLRDTSTHADDQIFFLLLQLAPAAQSAVDLLLRPIPDAACI